MIRVEVRIERNSDQAILPTYAYGTVVVSETITIRLSDLFLPHRQYPTHVRGSSAPEIDPVDLSIRSSNLPASDSCELASESRWQRKTWFSETTTVPKA